MASEVGGYTSSLLGSPEASLAGSFSSTRSLVRADTFRPRSAATGRTQGVYRQSSVRSSTTWLRGNHTPPSLSASEDDVGWSSDDERRAVAQRHHDQMSRRNSGVSSRDDRNADRRAASASSKSGTKCAPCCCSDTTTADKSRSRSAPSHGATRGTSRGNPLVQGHRGPPLPQPAFRPAGPGPKFVRNPYARTRTWRPVHQTLGFDARRHAEWTHSPPWQELREGDCHQLTNGTDDDDAASECSCGSCGDCGWLDCFSWGD